MPLTMAGAGAAGTVQRICGRDETRRFLAVCIKDTRVALSQQMASRIMIG